MLAYLIPFLHGCAVATAIAAVITRPRRPLPGYVFPTARQLRAARAQRITGLDVRDYATWPQRERLPGEGPV